VTTPLKYCKSTAVWSTDICWYDLFVLVVSITKASSSDPDFKGFLCQVRPVGQELPVGCFSVRDALKAQTLDCTRGRDSVTHKNNDLTAEQSFDWRAPSLGLGTQVEIVCTIVQNTMVLWVQQKSQQFKEIAATSVTTVRPG
jgi:hypothetical protein